MTFSDRVVAAWYAPRLTPLALLLWPSSLLFRAVVALRRALFRVGILRGENVGVPVVVVGNITAGGAGKTPLVLALAEALRARGERPGIVSRGYGGSAMSPRAVTSGDDPEIVGDEPLLFAAAGLPIWIGRDRVAAARGLLAANPSCTVLISDDGLQHYRLARTFEIAVIDGQRGLGNELLLPAGPLRESPARLATVDAVVRLENQSPSPRTATAREFTMSHVPLAWRSVVDAALTADASAWRGNEVHAVAGIGHPARFFAMLRAMGVDAIEHAFPDHHRYTATDVSFPAATAILMTQKDAVKCVAFADRRFWYLPLAVTVDPALFALVEHKIRGFQAA